MTAVSAQALEEVFQDCFLRHYRTLLRGGAPEPLYQPALWPRHCNGIHYREDFVASALHEVAHWCIAGPARRLLTDYGYWYHSDGRSSAEQQLFELAEYKAQALEWHFARACQAPFHLSKDNLATGADADSRLAEMVCKQAQRYCGTGLPTRAAEFREALAQHFDGVAAAVPADFNTSGL